MVAGDRSVPGASTTDREGSCIPPPPFRALLLTEKGDGIPRVLGSNYGMHHIRKQGIICSTTVVTQLRRWTAQAGPQSPPE